MQTSQIAVRRIELREHFELREPCRDVRIERRTQSVRIEQVEAPGQPVAGTRCGFDGEPPISELARLLPDRGAGDPERARELFS